LGNHIQIKQDEMGRTCSIYAGRTGACRVLWGNLKEKEHLEDIGAV